MKVISLFFIFFFNNLGLQTRQEHLNATENTLCLQIKHFMFFMKQEQK